MTYDDFIAEFRSRVLAVYNGWRTTLLGAGVAANRVIISEPDTVDLRLQIEASTGNGANRRTVTAYAELTDASRFGEPANGKGYITLFAQTNQGTQVANTYSPGAYEFYTDETGIEALRTKLSELEAAAPQLLQNARTYLRV